MVLKVKWKDDLRVHGLTDIHVGASEFHREKFHDAIQQIKRDKNALWFGNGDLVELIPPNYKISQRGQYSEPDDQILEFLELVKPIKDKCLFIRGGNHDTIRSINLLGVDVCKLIAREMNVPYYRMPGYSQFNVKGTVWNMASGHGKSGAANGDLELTKLSQVYSEAHVCFLGHNHQLYAKPVDSLRINGDEERLFRRWYIRGGSFLKYADYARYSFYPIVRTGWVTMEFTKDNIECWTN
jgi:predicted phosphodiesterase